MRNKFMVIVLLLVVFSILVLSIDIRDSRKIPVLKEYSIDYGDTFLKVWWQFKNQVEKSEFSPSTGSLNVCFNGTVMGVDSEIWLSFNRIYRLTSVYISTIELSEAEKQKLTNIIKASINEEYDTQTLYSCTGWTENNHELSFSAMRTGAVGECYSIESEGRKLIIRCFDCR